MCVCMYVCMYDIHLYRSTSVGLGAASFNTTNLSKHPGSTEGAPESPGSPRILTSLPLPTRGLV